MHAARRSPRRCRDHRPEPRRLVRHRLGGANWAVHVAAVNSGEAHAQALPTAPTPTSACTSPASAKTVKVSWTAVTHATAYAVYQSNTTATGTYTLQTSGRGDHLVDHRGARRGRLLV